MSDELADIVAQLEALYAPPPDLFAKLMELDDRLVAKGFPAMSQWWRDVFAGFYQSKKRWLVLRVGRRGGKSSSICRLAVVEVLYGQHKIPPGDIGYWPFISTKREEADARLVTVKAILDAIGVKYRPTEHGIIIEGRNVGFKTYVATIAGVSGFTGLGFLADEMAKWRDKDTGANPANQVLKSLKPCLATVPTAKGILASSPFSTIDAHAEAFDAGDTPAQMVAQAATWVTNPTVTESATHEMEEDWATWQREYAAIPMSSGESIFFDHTAVDDAMKHRLVMPVTGAPGTIVTAGADFAFISDHASVSIVHTIGEWKKARVRLADMLEVAPEPGRPLKPGAVVGAFAGKMKEHGCFGIMADGHYKMSIIEHLDEEELGFIDAPTDVAQPYIRTRVLLNGGRLELPEHARLRLQMKQVMQKPNPGGTLSIILPRKAGAGHCDAISGLVLGVYQDSGYEIPRDEAALTEADRMRENILGRWQEEQQAKEEGRDWLQRRMRR